ncbi:helix-turn-helix domain-containing protein [Bacteroides reticulotermitis]|uniref:Transcriptional regulator n=2 Tax=Bacteroides reticulotermitis TaxID=1133319 RepID=W4UZP6_9BACE|nr:helix-turn-helix domain-containing protein [Bacteroides reticulotermitis]MBB4043681.1 AraC-like DNA-binding protein [Bacteroides reticulotermitis]GAE86416.1 transcriptional regulator [Bacteroides reticulotermitis JCM 10512]
MKDKPYNHNLLNQLKEGRFIEIFRLQDIDDSFFNDYQRYDFFQLLWFTQVEGERKYFIDFTDYTFAANEVVLVYPGQIDRIDLNQIEGYLFAIDNDTFFHINQHLNSDYLNGYFSNVFVSLNEDIQQILEQILKLMLTEYEGKKRIMLLESYMDGFLQHITEAFEKTNTYKNILQNKSYTTIAALMKLIDRHFMQERNTDFYAQQLGLTPKKLNEVSLKGTGKTVKQHLQQVLLLEIKKEIRLNQKSIKEIAFDLGFSEPAYLTRFFKQQTAQTPTEFREMR